MARLAGREQSTLSLLLRSTPVGEADAMVSIFSMDLGKVDAYAPSARRPSKTRKLLLEPLHTLRITLRERAGRDLPSVASAAVETPRTGILASLAALEAAGQMLRWLRAMLPARHPEPEAWELAIRSLDGLSARGEDALSPPVLTAIFGLRLLWILGYQLELDQCVRCGRPCPRTRTAYVDPVAGGVRCAACGGGPVVAPPALRDAVRRAAEGEDHALDAASAAETLGWLTAAFDTHAGASRFAKMRGR